MYLSHPLICPAQIILLNSLFNILFNLRRVESLRRPVLRAAVGSHVWTSDSIVSLFDVFVINLFLFFSSEANYLLPSAHLHNVRVVLSCSFANQAVLIDVYDCRGENFKGLSVKPGQGLLFGKRDLTNETCLPPTHMFTEIWDIKHAPANLCLRQLLQQASRFLFLALSVLFLFVFTNYLKL